MELVRIRTIPGPNIYHRRPVLIGTIELGDLTETPSRDVAGFNERLLALLPGLHEHRCSRGHPGGFVERLNDGTYFAHIVEHVALELSTPAGIEVGFGKARWAGRDGLYDIIVRYKSERGMKRVLETAVDLVAALIAGKSFDLAERLADIREIVADDELGPSTRSIVNAAEARGIPWRRLNSASLIQLGYGKQIRRIQAALTDATGNIAVEIAQDKALTKKLLADAGLPVPDGRTVESEAEALAALHEIGAPVAVKPVDGHHGRAITLDVSDDASMRAAFATASDYDRSGHAIIEEMYRGRDYRVLVVAGKVVAAAERRPAAVIGDGKSTVAQLVERENAHPSRGDGHMKPLTFIGIDDAARRCMARQKLDIDSVPAAGQTVQLCETANLSTGGTPIDVTDRVHPAVASVCQRAAQIVGLDVCGVDLVLADISQAPAQGGIIEINAAPGLRMHLQPAEGTPRNVGAAIVDAMYRKDATHIPIVAITGTNGKTSTTRMIAHALSVGRAVGMTTSDGIVICGETVMTGDTTGPQSARIVLNDPRVEAAVLETARGGILRRGLGYDDADVAVITNIGSDHIGQDGLETIDDIARVKEVVAEQVRAGGTLVLNADDERVRAFARHAGGRRLAWFSASGFEIPEDGGADVIERLCYTVRKGWFVEIAGGSERRIVQVNAVPATLNGAAQFQVENALAGIAACRACGLSLEAVAAAMRSFDPVGHNPGRNNLYRVRGGYVLLDYGHNAHGLQALGRLVGQWKGYALTGVLEAPGDRADWVIEELGREAAAVFDRIVIYEPGDLRGRAAGEVPALLERAARSAGQDNCRVIPDAAAALRECLENMDEREIIVFCYDDLSAALEVLEQHGAVPVTNVPELREPRAGRRGRSAEVQAGR